MHLPSHTAFTLENFVLFIQTKREAAARKSAKRLLQINANAAQTDIAGLGFHPAVGSIRRALDLALGGKSRKFSLIKSVPHSQGLSLSQGPDKGILERLGRFFLAKSFEGLFRFPVIFEPADENTMINFSVLTPELLNKGRKTFTL